MIACQNCWFFSKYQVEPQNFCELTQEGTTPEAKCSEWKAAFMFEHQIEEVLKCSQAIDAAEREVSKLCEMRQQMFDIENMIKQYSKQVNIDGFTLKSQIARVIEWSGQRVENTEAENMTNERKNITQPSDWWAAFEEQAKAEGLTLAAWLGEAAKAKLPPKVAKKLTERPPANRPKKSE